jgi:hypothetical protein
MHTKSFNVDKASLSTEVRKYVQVQYIQRSDFQLSTPFDFLRFLIVN